MKRARFWKIAFACYLLMIGMISAGAYLRLLPPIIHVIPYFDKLAHFLLLGGASYLSHRALSGRRITRYTLPLGPWAVGLVSVCDEFIQGLVPWREFSFLDMACNVLGVLVLGWLAVFHERSSNAMNIPAKQADA